MISYMLKAGKWFGPKVATMVLCTFCLVLSVIVILSLRFSGNSCALSNSHNPLIKSGREDSLGKSISLGEQSFVDNISCSGFKPSGTIFHLDTVQLAEPLFDKVAETEKRMLLSEVVQSYFADEFINTTLGCFGKSCLTVNAEANSKDTCATKPTQTFHAESANGQFMIPPIITIITLSLTTIMFWLCACKQKRELDGHIHRTLSYYRVICRLARSLPKGTNIQALFKDKDFEDCDRAALNEMIRCAVHYAGIEYIEDSSQAEKHGGA